ncbi:MAG TPA: Fur family transcriptional regulator [Candidatus Paceibacterota bacterium]|jgi:Fe2+ or Zn2+ uptake regulation protein|nr:Fur family transcriptional regulator [Candidatus Paceibacterota bacterium]
MARKDDLRSILRKSGYKATPTRLAVLAVFKTIQRPLSAQEIIDQLPRDTDQATIYRTLKSFKTKGLIKQIDLRHNHAHYELAGIAEHHHLICLRCGRIEDVTHCDMGPTESAVLRASKHFAEIRQHALEFYGICKSCAAKNATAAVAAHKHAAR